eukprot:177608_1
MNAARGSLLQNIWAPSILLLLLVSTSCVSGSYGQSKSTTQGKYYADDLSDKDQDDELFELASKTTNMNINYDVVEKQSNDKTSSKNVKRKSKKSEKLKKRKKKECKVCNTTEMKPMLCRECRKGGNHKCVRYCSRKCQKIDWKKGGHRLECEEKLKKRKKKVCTVCKTTKRELKLCKGCREGESHQCVRYCSRKCEKIDWKNGGHRLECETFKKCNTCGKILKNVVSRCSRCKKAYYCNEKCQRKDWKTHKKDCTKLKTSSKGIRIFRWRPSAIGNFLEMMERNVNNLYYTVTCVGVGPSHKRMNRSSDIPIVGQNIMGYTCTSTLEFPSGDWTCNIQLKRRDDETKIIETNGPHVFTVGLKENPNESIIFDIDDKKWSSTKNILNLTSTTY